MTSRPPPRAAAAIALALAALAAPADKPATQPASAPYARWDSGPSRQADYFPIAVWLQEPRNAGRYKAAGFNLYVGLWKGPTARQLADLKAAGMQVICHQNALALADGGDPIIVGWMHGDEPDNAQALPDGKGYGPPIAPAKIVADCDRIRAADPTRPVLLNLGQGVAWDAWHGRGVRTNHPEDYPQYVKGCDIASFDIYPVVHPSPQVAGRLWYVAHGVRRLKEWSGPGRVVWNCIECSRISNTNVKPTVEQVRAEVWMSIIHGSRGLIYFVHQFKPRFVEASLLEDKELLAGVTAINRQVHSLAAVIHSAETPDAVAATSSESSVPIAATARRHGGATYVFAVGMRGKATTGTFRLAGAPGETVEVLGEDRRLAIRDGIFIDRFGPYGVHLYRLSGEVKPIR